MSIAFDQPLSGGLRDTADVLGCHIDRLDMRTTVHRAQHAIERRDYVQHVSINAAKLIAMRDDEDLRRIVRRCGIVSADGQSIVWASRLLGDPLPERVPGVDLMLELVRVAAEHGYRPFILGARADALERAVARLRDMHAALELAGWHDGYFAGNEAAVAKEIRDSGADMLFVAMSSPAKERFLDAYGASLGVPFVMGVGGSIDVIAGVVRRAPARWQRLGLEWLYRLLQEPRRMFKRYAMTNTRFVMLLARSLATRRLREAGAVVSTPSPTASRRRLLHRGRRGSGSRAR